MNDLTEEVFKLHEKPYPESPYVFPGQGGNMRTDIKKAGLPEGFRALHGLRHVYASMIASSGKVEQHIIQKLTGHKSPQMTERYSYLKDYALKGASNLVE